IPAWCWSLTGARRAGSPTRAPTGPGPTAASPAPDPRRRDAIRLTARWWLAGRTLVLSAIHRRPVPAPAGEAPGQLAGRLTQHGVLGQLERRDVRRCEAEDLAVEGQLGLQGRDHRLRLPEAVRLARERDVRVPDAVGGQVGGDRLGLRRRDDRVVEALQQ